jgi:hypothetical protein
MAKDFGSSEGYVNDEEFFFRGKKKRGARTLVFRERISVLVWVAGVEVRKVSGVEAIVVQIRWQLAPLIEIHIC